MRRAILAVVVVLALLSAGALASYQNARRAAAEFLGPLPPDVVQLHTGLVPLRPAPETGRLGWVVAYGPRWQPGHVGLEIYVAPFGGVVGTNPSDLAERVRAWQRR